MLKTSKYAVCSASRPIGPWLTGVFSGILIEPIDGLVLLVLLVALIMRIEGRIFLLVNVFSTIIITLVGLQLSYG